MFIFNFVRLQAPLNSFVIISTHSCLTFCAKVPQTNQAINFCNRSYFSSFSVFVLFLYFFCHCSVFSSFCVLIKIFSSLLGWLSPSVLFVLFLYLFSSLWSFLFCIFFVLCFNQNLPSQFVGMALSFCLANSIRKECEIV